MSLYIPSHFRVDDAATLHAFIRQYSFATLITTGAEPFITHLPLLLDADRGPHGTLVGHVARTNPHWQIDHALHCSTAVFHGPHAYISPSWYRSGSPAVPTWNYGVVHASGKLSLIHDREKIAAILDRMVKLFESSFEKPWKDPTPEVNEKLIAAVVGFEMPIHRLEGKFKLGQNRAAEDRIGAIESLEAAGDADGVALAKFAREYLGVPEVRSK